MITVAILINNEVVGLKYAVRMKDPDKSGIAQYRTNCKKVIEHNPKDGAKVLSKKLIDLMDLKQPFNEMPKDEQIKILLKLIKKVKIQEKSKKVV